MKRHFLFMTAALALTWAACSSDDDGDTETTTNPNQPGASAGAGGSAASSAAGAGGSAATSTAGSSSTAGSAGSASTSSAGSAGSSSVDGAAGSGSMAPAGEMSFFVTSEGSGELGGNLGGLEGADAICQRLAEAVDAGDKTWRAYLSTDTVDARDRIGEGPWFNQAGVMIASDLDELHAEDTVFNGNPNLILDENGVVAPGPEHDILTGTLQDGTAAPGLNCANWTSNDATLTENPQVGHSDIPTNPMFSPIWNAAHTSANCSQEGLTQRGGAGRLYCFAE